MLHVGFVGDVKIINSGKKNQHFFQDSVSYRPMKWQVLTNFFSKLRGIP